MQSESHLILVSNREPYEHRWLNGHIECQRTDGGLITALDPVLRDIGGTWVAWGSGAADPEAVAQADGLAVSVGSPSYRLRRVWLTPREIWGGGQGYANQVLWPLCHVTLDRVSYLKDYWESYVEMNRRFAQTVLDELQMRPGLVWVHDYHLALLPEFIKAASPDTDVCLFWHVPWPGPDVFKILPEREEILAAILATDCTTFQTARCVEAFAACAQQLVGADISATNDTVVFRGHRTRLTARPISVDFRSLSDLARSPEVEALMTAERRRLGLSSGMCMGLGVDRLDYTKGLLKRLWALDCFLARYPEYRGKFTFVQVAVPTRHEVDAYRRYRETIREAVSMVNAHHCKGGWHPVEYLEGRIEPSTLAAYYRMADFSLVSSVFDGMNLVAKEFVACQVDETGVLLISQMAGAAEELSDALIINPYDQEGLAEAMRQALEMPIGERQLRMRRLRDHVETHDSKAWAEGCLADAGFGTLAAQSL